MENEETTAVIIQSNLDIAENDLDLIIMFFESKKQSDGGDTIRSELIDKKLLKLVYESEDTKKRILNKKYFSFKKFKFKSFDHKVNGYVHDCYELNKKCLIIKDILLDAEFDPNNLDDSVTKMYAEHLSLDNDIIKINKSHLFDNTFYVTYKNELDWNHVMTRFNKKPKLRNQQITLFDSFNTKSFMIGSSVKSSIMNDFDKIVTKINEELDKKGLFDSYFLDVNDNYVIFQCENEQILHEVEDSVKIFLKSLNNSLMVENCFNFKLLNFVNPITREELVKKELVKQKSVDQDSQTEVNESLDPVKESQKIENKQEVANVENIKKKVKSPKSASSKKQEKIEEDLKIEKVKMDNVYLDNLIKSQTDNEVILNEQAPLSVGLINCAQLRADLDKTLSTFNTELYFNKKNKYKTLSIKFDNDSKNKVINVIKNFAKINFLYKIVHLPPSISKDPVLMDALNNYVPNLNKQYPGIYLHVNENSIHCYGYPKSLGKVLDTNCGLLKDIIEKRNHMNQTTINQKIECAKSEVSQDKKISKKLKPAEKSSVINSQPLKLSEESEENIETNNEWKQVKKSKKESPIIANLDKIVLYSSYEPIAEIKTVGPESIGNSNFVLIDPKHYNVLSICLLKCHQVAIDFINDLKIISPICQLVFVDDKQSSSQNSGILIDTADEKYIEPYKVQIDKLLGYYEKNRLKHIYNLIDDKLTLDEVFPTLISNFNSKNELNDLKIILEMIYNSDKVLHAQLTDKKLLEIYGYTNAVQNYDNYALDILNKTINHFNNNLNSLLAFKLYQKDMPKMCILFMFDSIYFNDFVSQITACDAHVVKINELRAIHVACFNKKLRNNPKKLEILNDIKVWRENIDAFINEYLDLFSIEELKMPFSRKSEECKNIIYDKNILDISWLDDEHVEIIGLKEEIQKFKLRIF